MKILVWSAFLALSTSSIAQSSYTGIATDNTVSAGMAVINPSAIVDSKTKLTISTRMNFSSISNFNSANFLPYGNTSKYIEPKNSGYLKRYQDLDVLNVKYEFDHKNAGAYSLRVRSLANTMGIPTDWTHNAVYKYDSNFVNNPQDLSGMSMNQILFTEHAFSYGRTIFDRQTSFLKAGVTLKILNGLDARYYHFNSGSILFPDTSSTDAVLSNADVDFGKNMSKNQLSYKNRGLGFDLGVTYEFRPNYEDQYYEMDGAKRLVRYDRNKYKWKATASITDLGFARFIRDTLKTFDFTNPGQTFDASKLLNVSSLVQLPFMYIQDSIQINGTKSPEQISKYRMNLPTTFHAGFDMNVLRNFYVSYNVSLPLSMKNDITKIKGYFIHTITPRVEKEKWSIMLPISQLGNGRVHVGLAGRFLFRGFSVFAGSNNMALLYGQKASLSRNFFVGIAYNVLYKVPSDRDGDKISDELDECPDDPGLPENNGCPDSDGDGIIDKVDLCIYEKGLRKNRGCPDTDEDGIIDMNDMCPNDKGLGIHYGCPDSDKDGVIDAADRCPDVPGVELNNGCPLEIQGCCLDEDGDGVVNEKDKCPNEPGSVYNSGCPINDKNINNINLQQQKEQKDANNTGQQVKENPQIDVRNQFLTSQSALDSIMKGKRVMKSLSVYFDVDEATLRDGDQTNLDKFMKTLPKNERFEIILIGYTDRDGSLDYNLALSRRRAETVKRKLVDVYKFDPKNVNVYYYGETKSIHKGDYTEELKQADRRVDVKLIRLPKQ